MPETHRAEPGKPVQTPKPQASPGLQKSANPPPQMKQPTDALAGLAAEDKLNEDPHPHVASVDPMWCVTIIDTKNDLVVKGFLPEQFTESVGSHWEPIFDWQPPGLVKLGAVALGASTTWKWTNAQFWTGQEPYQLTIPIEFRAVNSAYYDVVLPIRNLLNMASPSEGGNFNTLIPPGPNYAAPFFQQLATSGVKVATATADAFVEKGSVAALQTGMKQFAVEVGQFDPVSNGGGFTVQIGRWREVRQCVILNVEVEWQLPLDRNGWPMKATVTVTLQSSYIMLKGMF